MGEHSSSITTEKENYSIPQRFKEAHNSTVNGLRVFGIEAITNDLDSGKKTQNTMYKRGLLDIHSKILNEGIKLHNVV